MIVNYAYWAAGISEQGPGTLSCNGLVLPKENLSSPNTISVPLRNTVKPWAAAAHGALPSRSSAEEHGLFAGPAVTSAEEAMAPSRF